jgi:hypothetical protein
MSRDIQQSPIRRTGAPADSGPAEGDDKPEGQITVTRPKERVPDMKTRRLHYWQGRGLFILFTFVSSLIFTVGFPLANNISLAWYWAVALSLGVGAAFLGIPDFTEEWHWRTPFELTWHAHELPKPLLPSRRTLLFRGLLIFMIFTLHGVLLAMLCGMDEVHDGNVKAVLYPSSMLYAPLLVFFDHLLLDILRRREYEFDYFDSATPSAQKDVVMKYYDLRLWLIKTMVSGFFAIPIGFCWVAAQNSWRDKAMLTPGTIWGMILAAWASIGLLLGVVQILGKLNEDLLTAVLRIKGDTTAESTSGEDNDGSSADVLPSATPSRSRR